MYKNNTFCVLILFAILILVFCLTRPQISNFRFTNADYQYHNPNALREKKYYGCFFEECNGNQNDYDCLEKCKLKAFTYDSPKDIQSLVCQGYTKDDYYRCLSEIYSDYKYP